MNLIAGLAEIASAYDEFIVDLWGVLHDGVRVFPDAATCLRQLRGRPIHLLSNAPRRASVTAASLERLGIDRALYTDLMTSGEATWRALATRPDPWFAALGRRVFHLGPERDRSVIENLAYALAASPDAADFVLNTGPDDAAAAEPAHAFDPVLRACYAATLPMLCANPDRVVIRDGIPLTCAGALAARYRAMGGEVRLIGKPDPAIYDMLLGASVTPRTRILAIGDSLATDIAGAAAAGIPSLWVLGGIHRHEASADDFDLAAYLRAAKLAPAAVIPMLAW